MPAKRDEVKVRVTLDDKTKAGLQSATKNIKTFSKTVASVGGAANVAFGNLAARGISGAVGGIRNLVRETFNLNDRFHKLNLQTQLSVGLLSTLHHAAGFADTSLEGLVKGFTNVVKNAGEANKGLMTYTRLFDQLGIETRKFVRLSSDQQFIAFIDALSKLETHAAKLNVAMLAAGRPGKEMIQTFANGKATLDEFREGARKTGVLLDQKFADAFAKSKDEIWQMEQSLRALGNVILLDVIPPLTSMLSLLTSPVRGWRWLKELVAVERSPSYWGVHAAEIAPSAAAPRVFPLTAGAPGAGQFFASAGAGAAPRGPARSPFGRRPDGRAARSRMLGRSRAGYGAAYGFGPGAAAGGAEEMSAEERRRAWQLGSTEELQQAALWEESIRRLRTPVRDLKDDFADLKFAIEGWGQSFADRLLQGELSFKSFVDSMLREMIRYQLTMQSNKVFGLLGDLLANAAGNWFGGRAANPNAIAASATTAHSPAGRGYFMGQSYASHESGSHYIDRVQWAQLHPGERVVPAGMRLAGGGGAPIINIYNNAAGASVQAAGRQTAGGEQMIDIGVFDSVGRGVADGSFDDMFGAAYGLGRVGASVG